MEIKSIILAAGKGTRMKSEKSKVLHEILGKSLLGYVLDNVKNLTNENIVIVGHKAEQVSDFIEKNYDCSKTILQIPQLGTGHAVSMACPDLENFNGNVLILCGDTPLIKEETLKNFVEYHNSVNSDITVMSAIFDDPTNYGRIIREDNNSLNCIVEEKDATLEQKLVKEVNAGIYCLNWSKVKRAFSELKSNNAQNEYYLTDIISWGKENDLNVNAYIMDDNTEIYGINSRVNLAKASKMINERKLETLMNNGVTIVDPDSTWISEDTQIGSDTVILPYTYIEGKNKIGKNCQIGP
ncbi:bifunctional N-acetylglucosamine-1-phosphate uridyltransferase/glucosamine-1-phosphate acetyltransferase, partial [bacterium]|nr:bifunctional N-acetylglucosamine-1-phosphate uridyltransferase/glucosamine-1-phosphate acetyltransferase [bacterium]